MGRRVGRKVSSGNRSEKRERVETREEGHNSAMFCPEMDEREGKRHSGDGKKMRGIVDVDVELQAGRRMRFC